ncbi:hypothetical protein [Acuticoccus mangrovi]|uniref:MotA/TolQ/ExbB proton channel domain-containing protein n=1 Tax=Acuticoccus mangrovi TaxID=2796142 RepID=A0A934IK77_9HYPH|nr:hypothetical protein [Acuticoccus mangrovi]MBJ3775307.1 hypothetical protein [Acuticoccus mangrovi]
MLKVGLLVEQLLHGLVLIFTRPGIGGALAVGVLLFAAIVCVYTLDWYISARLEIWRARRVVEHAFGSDVHARRRAFASEFDEINSALARLGRIGPAWAEFEETLIKPDASNTDALGSSNIRNVRRPQDFISLRATGMGGEFVRSFPGVIVGLGLVLTFVGLIAALTVAAGNLDEAMTPTGMRDVLGTLLGTAGAKFYASATALACSIVLGLLQRRLFASLVGQMQSLNHALEDRLQYDETALSRVEQLRVIKEQNDQMRDLAADIALQIGNQVAEKVSPLNATLGATMEAVAAKLDRIADQTGTSIASTLGDRFETALADTLSQLDGTLKTVRFELTALPNQLSSAVGAMDTATSALAGRFGQVADKGAEEASAQIEASLAPILNALGDAARTIEAAGGAVTRGADQALETMTDRFGAAGIGFEEAATKAGAGLARESEAAAVRLSAAVAPVEAAGEAIGRAATAIAAQTQTMVDAAERFSESLSESRSAHRSIAGLVIDATRAAETATERQETIAARSLTLADQLDRSGSVVSAAIETLKTTAEQLAGRSESVAADTSKTADRIAETLKAAQEALSQHVARYDNLDDRFAAAFTAFQEVIAAQQRDLAHHVQEIDRAFASAVGELQELVDDLSGLNRASQSPPQGARV